MLGPGTDAAWPPGTRTSPARRARSQQRHHFVHDPRRRQRQDDPGLPAGPMGSQVTQTAPLRRWPGVLSASAGGHAEPAVRRWSAFYAPKERRARSCSSSTRTSSRRGTSPETAAKLESDGRWAQLHHARGADGIHQERDRGSSAGCRSERPTSRSRAGRKVAPEGALPFEAGSLTLHKRALASSFSGR